MKLEELLKGIEVIKIEGRSDISVTSLIYDSRKASPGAVFVCLKGAKSDGHIYASDVASKGASVIIAEDEINVDTEKITVVYVKDSRLALALSSANFFGHPLDKLTLVGITGTKGKTTTAHMVKSIIESAGFGCGMVGTMGAFIGDEKIPTKNTTPESYELQYLFNEMVKKGCKYAVIEASSQAFKLRRTAGISFDYAAFLNISPDHIGEGEHKDFEDYLECKSMMFGQTKETIVNIDADRWQDAIRRAGDNYHSISVKEKASLYADNIKMLWSDDMLGISFDVHGDMEGSFKLGIPGEFNVENALIAMEITHLMGISDEAIRQGLRTVYVKGRTQLLHCALPITTMIIDYAHNALSMEQLLTTLRSYEPKRLICLFGGGGNKPKQRRYDMGAMSAKYADLTILTMDNPRFEEIDDINKDILVGVNEFGGKYEIINDRKEAIRYLLDNAKKDDMIALIGKGHEEYQEVKGERFHFSEQEIVEEYMEEYMKEHKA